MLILQSFGYTWHTTPSLPGDHFPTQSRAVNWDETRGLYGAGKSSHYVRTQSSYRMIDTLPSLISFQQKRDSNKQPGSAWRKNEFYHIPYLSTRNDV